MKRNVLFPVFLAAGAVVAAACGAGALVGLSPPPPSASAADLGSASAAPVPGFRNIPVSVPPARPLGNDGSAGSVVLTFDDGPDAYTQALLNELQALHLKAVFFVIGFKAQQHPSLVREEVSEGDLVENHTYDHISFTGASTDTPVLPASKIRAELATANLDIVKAGAPKPLLYRPPFGDVNPADNEVAATLGLRIVEPFSVTRGGRPLDSRDWTGASAAAIARDVTHGYWVKAKSAGGGMFHVAGLHAGSVIGFHDSSPGDCAQQQALCYYAVSTIRSLPAIVAYMNAHHLGVTVRVPSNATGGAVPNIPVR